MIKIIQQAKLVFWIILLISGIHVSAGYFFTLKAQSHEEINLANEYFKDGEYEKALQLYEKILKAYPDVEFYLTRVIDCYAELGNRTAAEDFIARQTRRNNSDLILFALKGKIAERFESPQQAEQIWNDLIQNKIKVLNDFYKIGGFFISQQKYSFALKTYLQGRTILKTEDLFTNELAYLHQFEGNFEQSTQEYVKMLLANNSQYTYVRSQISTMIKDGQHVEKVERALLGMALKYSENTYLIELLYDFYLETNNYPEALIQARSLDKLKGDQGNTLFKFAQTLQNNKEYEISNEALEYIIRSYKSSPIFIEAIKEKAKNFELKAAETIPLDTASLREAVKNYDALFTQYGRVPQLEEAMYRKARLCVFYLNDLNSALKELDEIEKLPVANIRKAEAKLLQGDILILQGEYNKAKLKYTEVEKQFENTQTGAKAKFRIARLSYYKGDFESAKAYLKILKENTSTDISNDAIKLYLTIQDNTGLDSTTTALERFAHAELLIYQKQYSEALKLLDSIAFAFPNHELTDDILWEKANIHLNQNNINLSLDILDKIIAIHNEGIYADDAQFKKAEIYEFVLKDKAKAIEYYFEILTKFPSSLYKVEARKRVRKLRGDTLNN